MADSCLEYDAKIAAAGGIDLQVLGIGPNGHIGFNEPHAYLKVQTHAVDLTPETVAANSRFFDTVEEVPRQAVTMGMGSIMQARRILLLASGAKQGPGDQRDAERENYHSCARLFPAAPP
jgi:glucosamine-6-phosphate deaminase